MSKLRHTHAPAMRTIDTVTRDRVLVTRVAAQRNTTC